MQATRLDDPIETSKRIRHRRTMAIWSAVCGSLVTAAAAMAAFGIFDGFGLLRSSGKQSGDNEGGGVKVISEEHRNSSMYHPSTTPPKSPDPSVGTSLRNPFSPNMTSFSPHVSYWPTSMSSPMSSVQPSTGTSDAGSQSANRPSTSPSTRMSTNPSTQLRQGTTVESDISYLPTPSSMLRDSRHTSSKPTSESHSTQNAITLAAPSKQPYSSPSISLEPTHQPAHESTTNRIDIMRRVSSTETFHLRLHWRQGFKWQGSDEESWFCMACAWCDVNIFNDICNVNRFCEENMMLATGNCDPEKMKLKRGRRFITSLAIVNGGGGPDGDQIQVDGTDLCLYREGARSIVLRRCDASVERQRFFGFRSDGQAMELHPFPGTFKKKGVTFQRCLTQHHHPRRGEQIIAEECEKARKSNTNLWSTY